MVGLMMMWRSVVWMNLIGHLLERLQLENITKGKVVNQGKRFLCELFSMGIPRLTGFFIDSLKVANQLLFDNCFLLDGKELFFAEVVCPFLWVLAADENVGMCIPSGINVVANCTEANRFA